MMLLLFTGVSPLRAQSLVNPDHLNTLYEEIGTSGREMALIHIYADYPSYAPTEAPGEGIACVDDVARAAIFYARYAERNGHVPSMKKARRLIRFILNLQAENGFFFNFIKKDHTINRDRENSRPVADWWSWRAMWAIAETMSYAQKDDPTYFKELQLSFLKAWNAAGNKNSLRSMPHDQAAVLLLALSAYLDATPNADMSNAVRILADNILKSQRGNETRFPYFAFMSWRNTWHGWGNSQAFALLRAGRLLRDSTLYRAASNEIRHFYPYLLSRGHLKQFKLDRQGKPYAMETYEQIAYAVRPMVWAALERHRISGDPADAQLAARLAAWFFKENTASALMYDPKSGKGYDGIDSPEHINPNAGAESTIEALLTIMEVENNPAARRYLHALYRKVTHE